MQAQFEGYAEAIQTAVLAMPAARTLKLKFTDIQPGRVELEIPYQDDFSFRPGQLQATSIFAAGDFAAVAAAGTLLPNGWINATIDCTLKIVGPADGDKLVARGRVIKPGKLVTFSSAEIFSSRNGSEALCAVLLATARNIGPAQ